jgi:hypothetical protein
MHTICEGFVVKRPEAELVAPTIGEHGGVSFGASHLADVGPVFHVALHHPDGTTLIATFGMPGFATMAHEMNALGAARTRGELDSPTVAH